MIHTTRRLALAFALIAAFALGPASHALAQAAGGGSPGVPLSQLGTMMLGKQTPPTNAPVAEPENTIEDALVNGRIHVDLRLRYEFAEIDGFDDAHAGTARLRLGYGTKPLRGFSAYAEFEGTLAVDDQAYNSTRNGQVGESIIADPEVAELNQLFAKYQDHGATVIVGRQRIIFDDARFVGNVGWRQDEQTYDAALVGYAGPDDSALDNLGISYAYVMRVNRIFADDRDWDADSHLVNAWYDGWAFGKLTAFGYFLDFTDDAPAAGNNTVGLRFAGSTAINDDLDAVYAASYAHQWDGGATDAFEADYYLIEGGVKVKPWATTFGVGYEVLGSDDGRYGFATPLATGHKFQGFADAFLATPALGIQDVYAWVATMLPWEIQGQLVGHAFWEHAGGEMYGYELDAVATKKLTDWMSVTAKLALYEDEDDNAGAPVDRVRFWLQADIKF